MKHVCTSHVAAQETCFHQWQSNGKVYTKYFTFLHRKKLKNMAAVVDEIVEPVVKDEEQNEEEGVEDVGETNGNTAVKKKKKKKKKKKGT